MPDGQWTTIESAFVAVPRPKCNRRMFCDAIGDRLGVPTGIFTRPGALARALRRSGVSRQIADDCEFLMREGVLDRAEFQPRNDEMARRYGEGTVSAEDFCDFYVATLTGRSPADWRPWCERFLSDVAQGPIRTLAEDLQASRGVLQG